MNFKNITNQKLLDATGLLVREERRIGIEILWHFREIETRMAYIEAGCTSLFVYATKILKYSEAAAYRRISAMKMLRDNPEIADLVRDGKLSVTTVSQVEGFLKFEKIQNKKSYSREEKQSLLARVQEKSTRQVERELVIESQKITANTPHAKPWVRIRAESNRLVGEKHLEITFTAEKALCQKLERVRDVAAHRLGRDGTYAALFDLMAEITLEKIDPMRKALRHAEKSARRNGKTAKKEEKLRAEIVLQ